MQRHRATTVESFAVRSLSVVVLIASTEPTWAQTNARVTMSIDGPCGQTLLGPPGSLYDDGTGGGAPYFNTRDDPRLDQSTPRNPPGHTWVVYMTTQDNPGQLGAAYWAFGLGEDGILDITDITLNGTAGCNGGFPECRRTSGFAFTWLTGPPDGFGPGTEGNRGAASAVQLKFDGAQWLPAESREPIARIRVVGTFPASEGDTAVGRIWFTRREISPSTAGVPSVDINGTTFGPDFSFVGDPPLELEECVVILKATSVSPFIRCDANSDGRLEVSDAVAILVQVFLGAEASCRAASDCNGDGDRNVSDAIWWLTYLFRRGPPPPEPFPSCERIDIPVEECPPASTACP